MTRFAPRCGERCHSDCSCWACSLSSVTCTAVTALSVAMAREGERLTCRDCPAHELSLCARCRAAITSLVSARLFGRTWGDPFEDHLGLFLDALEKPLVTTLHSVLPDPSPSIRAAVRRIVESSRHVVVMAERARTLLLHDYAVAEQQVVVVPHGVPPVQPHGRTRIKEQFDLTSRTIITTFGLVDPRKGLEYMIEAMESVRQQDPTALYLIVGKTHLELVRREGEAYRRQLWRLVRDRGLQRHVEFVDEYLTQAQIVDYLLASDVYVTPYLDPKQITSGTLAYALGAGKAIVSTPYPHALEVLTAERGILVPFRSQSALADATLRILSDPPLKRRLEQGAYAYGRETAWPRVGESMLDILRAATIEFDIDASRRRVLAGATRT